jgi:AcrR family transcriptional regulator
VPTQKERSDATRARLLAAARQLFAKRGYAATSLGDVVRRARVTKGAFYHHFASKEAIFLAVFEDAERQLVEKAAAGARGKHARDRFLRGCIAFLEATQDPSVQRIVLRDAPAVLGWEKWREIDWRYGLAAIERGLEQAMAEGGLARRPTHTLAHLIFGALCESAMVIARSPSPDAARAQVARDLDVFLTSLLSPG